MNNENKKSSRISAFVAGKGFYIVLFLCLAAIGISGYFLASSLFGSDQAVIADLSDTEAGGSSAVMSAGGQAEEASAETGAVAVMGEADVDAEAAEAAAQAAEDIRIWPLSGGISKDYSVEALVFSTTTGDWRVHDGVDLTAYLGEPVMAMAAGTVTDIYDDDLYGTTVVITHDGSVSSKYSNLSAVPTVTVGQSVAAGDVIGAVGDTSLVECADAPHLHLQVFQEGISINPKDYIEG